MADKEALPDDLSQLAPGRDLLGRFQPGYSGNRAGRPVVLAEVRAAARRAALSSLATLARIRDDDRAPPGVRAAAADRLLQWAFGGPAGMSDARRRLDQLTDRELEELYRNQQRAAADALGELSDEALDEAVSGRACADVEALAKLGGLGAVIDGAVDAAGPEACDQVCVAERPDRAD